MNRLRYSLVVFCGEGVVRESEFKFPNINNVWDYANNSELFKRCICRFVCEDDKIVSAEHPMEKLIGKCIADVVKRYMKGWELF